VISNFPPVIDSVVATPAIIDPGENTSISCSASDPDGDPLTYSWFALLGSIGGEGQTVIWTSPEEVGFHWVGCTAEDPAGAAASDSVGVVVGDLVGDYPFDGSSLDQSGFDNHATVTGAVLVEDRFGNPSSAYQFDGLDDVLMVSSHPSIDFSEEVGLSLWFKSTRTLSRESFLISHGSWQNRWKVSVTPEQRIRWTIKTSAGVKDLDSKAIVVQDSVFHLAVTYDQVAMKIYVNGTLDNEGAWSGSLQTTSLDLTVGQMLPGDAQWNFEGVIDDVRIYNRTLSGDEVQVLYGSATALEDPNAIEKDDFSLYPNPFSGVVTLAFETRTAGAARIHVYDVAGRLVRTVLSGDVPAGVHRESWDGRDAQGLITSSGMYVVRLEVEGSVRYGKIVHVAARPAR
jgi:hypothetical protein